MACPDLDFVGVKQRVKRIDSRICRALADVELLHDQALQRRLRDVFRGIEQLFHLIVGRFLFRVLLLCVTRLLDLFTGRKTPPLRVRAEAVPGDELLARRFAEVVCPADARAALAAISL